MALRRDPPRWSKRGRGTRQRQLARQRAQKVATTTSPGPAPTTSESVSSPAAHVHDDERDLDAAITQGGYAPEETPKRGVLEVVFGFFSRRSVPIAASATVPPGDDPVRAILALPRGPARLDAFASTLKSLPVGTHGHRGVALAFHRELTTLATSADVDLSLLQHRVEACAEGLLAAGDAERAGKLLARVGKKRRAAELFVGAGMIEDLEAMHAALSEDTGGAHLSARLAYERFEALFVVGHRAEALAALTEAVRLRPEHAAYHEVLRSFAQRVCRSSLRLEREGATSAGPIALLRSERIVVGRGEEAALRLASPLLSREHVEIFIDKTRATLHPLLGRPVLWQGRTLEVPQELQGEGRFAVEGIEIAYRVEPDWLWVWAVGEAAAKVGVMRTDAAQLSLGRDLPTFGLRVDDEGRFFALPDEDVKISGEALRSPLLLLSGDRVRGRGSQVLRIT
ncbi:MAG: hypothetical protein ACO3JL_00565 [Myxococcota bacterium]